MLYIVMVMNLGKKEGEVPRIYGPWRKREYAQEWADNHAGNCEKIVLELLAP